MGESGVSVDPVNISSTASLSPFYFFQVFEPEGSGVGIKNIYLK